MNDRTELFRRLRPLYGRKIDALWIEYQTADLARKAEIEALLNLVAMKRLGLGVAEDKLLLQPPPEELVGRGAFRIGRISYPGVQPYDVVLQRSDLLRHVFILGPTGSGKSTLIIGLLRQLLLARVPFMCFDFKKNYRCLRHAPRGNDLVVYTVGRDVAPLQLNVLAPPSGVQFEEWADALSDIISDAYLLLQGARNVLREALLSAQRAHGAGVTLVHAHELLRAELMGCKAGSRRYGWLESSTRSLEELTKGRLRDAFNHGVTTVGALLQEPIVFELESLADDQKRFFCLYFLQAVLHLRKCADAPREVLQHALIFDEAHNVFPKEKYGEISVASRLAREIREFGEAIISATQQSDINESIIANSGTKIILRCDYPRDVTFASQLLQLKNDHLPRLKTGEAVIRLPSRYLQPYLITFDEQPLKNERVTDAEIRREAPTALCEEVITAREEELLRDIAAQPISLITKRYERLGWNAKIGNTIKDALISHGLARFDDVSTPTARVKILSLTQKGEAYLRTRGVTLDRERAGGTEHEYWRWAITERLTRKGYNVISEAPIGNGKTVDLKATRGDDMLWIEVETGRSDIAANIEKCRELHGRVIFVFTKSTDRNTYAEQLPDALTVEELQQL